MNVAKNATTKNKNLSAFMKHWNSCLTLMVLVFMYDMQILMLMNG